MRTIPLLMLIAGGLLVWWSLTEFKIIGPNQALRKDASGKRIPGGYESPQNATH